MKHNPEVRRATIADVQLLVGLMKNLYSEAGFAVDEKDATASFSNLLSRASLGSAWIAFMQGKAIGHAVMTVRYTMEHGGLSGYVDDLFVEKEYRRQGAGTQLLLHLQDECLARHCKALIVSRQRQSCWTEDLREDRHEARE
jgi:GNAT superfamily N-acetyltransferase